MSSATVVVLENVEDRAEYEAMLNDVLDDLAPVGALETLLAERVAIDFWRLRRILWLETENLNQWQLDQLPSRPLLDAQCEDQANRDSVLSALGRLFLPPGHNLERNTTVVILNACLEVLNEYQRNVFLGVPSQSSATTALEQLPLPLSVGGVLEFIRAGESRLDVLPREPGFDSDTPNLIATVYQYWAGVNRQWLRLSGDARRSAERQRTDGLLSRLEKATGLDRYEARIRRDVSRTLAEYHAVRAMRRQRNLNQNLQNEPNAVVAEIRLDRATPAAFPS